MQIFSLTKLESSLRNGLKWSMVIGFSIASLLYLTQFLLRLFFQYSLPEISWGIQYGFVMSALLGSAYAVKKNENIKIELFRELSKNKWVRIINGILSILVTLLILWIFYEYTSKIVFNSSKNNLESFTSNFKSALIILPYFYLFFVSLISYILRIVEAVKSP